MAINVPLICDWLTKDEQQAVGRHVRFEFAPGPPPVLTVEDMLGDATDDTISVAAWRESTEIVMTLAERAFSYPRQQWTRDVDPNLELSITQDGTRVTVEALPSGDVFNRVVDFAVVGGVDSIILRAYAAYDPITVHMWRLWHNAVDSLIELNNGGSTQRGL